MVSLRTLGVLFMLLVLVNGAFADEAEVASDEDGDTRLSFPGVVNDPNFKSLSPSTPPSSSLLKKERDRQLRTKGMGVTVWIEAVNVEIPQTNGNPKILEAAAFCPVRVVTNDLQCAQAEYGDIHDVAISCREYGPWDCSDKAADETVGTCRSKRKMVFKGAGESDTAEDLHFRVLAHAGSDPFPETLPFSVDQGLPQPLDICRGQGNLDGTREQRVHRCRLKFDPLNQDKPGYSNVVKYTVFKKEVVVTDPNPDQGEPETVGFQCPPVDPYFIIRR